MKKISFVLLVSLLLFIVYGCFFGGRTGDAGYEALEALSNDYYGELDNYLIDNHETYTTLTELPFVDASINSESYISLDSSTAAYANLRHMINDNYRTIRKDAIRTDELINYFDYDFASDADATFSSYAEISRAPWNPEHYLLTIGVKTKKVNIERYSQGNNYVFLVDKSGSMAGESRIGLVKQSIIMLLDYLNPNDTISLVTYASGVETICSGIKASNKELVKEKVAMLTACGSTSGGKGLEMAYNVAQKHFIEGGNNRIIIATDGDFNVGISTPSELLEFIQEKAKTGVYITCLGFGMYNFRDDMMEAIAKNGNGNYAYIDSLDEARKVLIDQMDTALCTVAKDVKAMVKFNPAAVESYRLIGYENKTLTKDQYENQDADAGEIGSNHTTMICYELELTEQAQIDELMSLEIKYKDPISDEPFVYQNDFTDLASKEFSETSEDFRFVEAIVEFSQILRESAYLGTSNIEHVLAVLRSLSVVQTNPYKSGFLTLVEAYVEKYLNNQNQQ